MCLNKRRTLILFESSESESPSDSESESESECKSESETESEGESASQSESERGAQRRENFAFATPARAARRKIVQAMNLQKTQW